MEITLDKTTSTEAIIKIKLIEADYQPAVEEKLKEYSRKAQIKGFRPGKVPKQVIQRMFGKSVLAEEINDLLSKKLQQYITENDINVLGDPLPNTVKDGSINWDTQKEFEFEYTLGMAEDFEVNVNDKVVVEAYNITMSDNTLAETVSNLTEQMGEMTNPETSESGDSLYGNLVNTQANIDRNVTIDISELTSKASKKFIGCKADDIISFNLIESVKEETYATNLTGASKEELKTIDTDFTFTVKTVNRLVRAEVNQDLFDKAFGKDVVKSKEEFEQKIIDTINENYQRESEAFLNYTIKNKVRDNIKFALPEQFLKEWLFRINEGKFSMDEIEKDFVNYTKDLRWTLIRNKTVKDNSIKLENAEIIEEAKKNIINQLQSSGIPVSMFADRMDDFADRFLKDDKGENYVKIFNQLLDRKVIEHFKNAITIKTKNVTAEEFGKLELN